MESTGIPGTLSLSQNGPPIRGLSFLIFPLRILGLFRVPNVGCSLGLEFRLIPSPQSFFGKESTGFDFFDLS